MKTNNDVKQIHSVKIADLIPAEYNPRKLSDKQRADLTASLEEFGFDIPIVVNQHKDRKNVIVGGHQRAKVAQEIGYEEVPAIFVSLTLEKEKQFNIRLNKNGGEFDYEKLDEFFAKDELVDWGFEEWEFPVDEIEEEKELNDISDDLTLEHKLEVSLKNENEQESLYNKLTQEGFKCRILTL